MHKYPYLPPLRNPLWNTFLLQLVTQLLQARIGSLLFQVVESLFQRNVLAKRGKFSE